MFGAIIGDIVGSRYEFHNHLSKDFDLFAPSCTYTDDTVMTCAVADLFLQHNPEAVTQNEAVEMLRKYGGPTPEALVESALAQQAAKQLGHQVGQAAVGIHHVREM